MRTERTDCDTNKWIQNKFSATYFKILKSCGFPGTRALIIAHHGDNGGNFIIAHHGVIGGNHVEINAGKYSTWSKKSDANPPEGDTKPPEGDTP